MTTEVVLNTFDPRTIGQNRVIVYIGKRGSGKTFVMEDHVYYMRQIPEGVVFSASEEGNETWGKHFPDLYIHTNYDSDVLLGIFNRQKDKAAKRRREGRRGVPEAQRTRVSPILIIVEDQSFKKSIFNCPVMREVLMNGRHYGITLLITTQYSRSINAEMRSQFDFVICCLEKFFNNRRRLFEDYFGVFPNFGSFNQVMMQCTENFGCLIMNNITRSCKIQDSVFYYKAKDHGDYKFGSRAYWLHHFMAYRDEDEATPLPNPFELLQPKSQVTVSTRVVGKKHRR